MWHQRNDEPAGRITIVCTMRILTIDTCYQSFLSSVYEANTSLDSASYDEQKRIIMSQHFGTADYYSRNLSLLGHEASEVIDNCKRLQVAWAREHCVPLPFRPSTRAVRGRTIPWIRSDWFERVLLAQTEEYRPDVILNHDTALSAGLLKRLKANTRLLVAQHAASPLRDEMDWSVYDLALSSFPPTLLRFRDLGVTAERFRLGLEPGSLLPREDVDRDIPVAFVGSFTDIHTSRTRLLRFLAARVPLSIWGPLPSAGFDDENMRASYRGGAWGKQMFEVLGRSQMVVNHHGNVAPFANNMRMYEATGSRALLITDWKPDLDDIFYDGKEVVSYRTDDECLQKIEYYLKHDQQRRDIASAGQERSLRDHTYRVRMQELTELLGRYLV
jgi:spore maturation protein CgeB